MPDGIQSHLPADGDDVLCGGGRLPGPRKCKGGRFLIYKNVKGDGSCIRRIVLMVYLGNDAYSSRTKWTGVVPLWLFRPGLMRPWIGGACLSTNNLLSLSI